MKNRWIPLRLKHWVAGLAVIVGLSAASQPTQAAGPDVVVLLNGKPLSFDVPPQIIQDRTFVPFRALLEALGANVWWDGATRTAYANKDGVTVRIPIGSKLVYRNGQAIQMDVEAQLVQNRTLIPLRFVSEALGAQVDWKPASATTPLTVFVQTASSAANAETSPQIEVVNGDGRVSPDKMQQIQNLLQNGRIGQKVAQAFRLRFTQPVRVYLAADKAGYRQVMLAQPAHPVNVDEVAQFTDGLAKGNDVFIPLSEHPAESDLKNVLAHELTHVLFFQNGLNVMPSWLNEGLAWHQALQLEYENLPNVVSEGRKAELKQYILKVKQDGRLIGLLSDSEQTIAARPGYNVEIQDWAAVEYLIGTYGYDKVLDYLSRSKQLWQDPFRSVFGLSAQSFETNFNAYLDNLIQRTDRGVQITFRVTDEFHGQFLLLPKGQTQWRVYSLPPGEYTVTVLPDGTVSGLSGGQLRQAAGAGEIDVVYVGLALEQEVVEQGNGVRFAGFAIQYGYGEYFLLNGWKSFTNGSNDYLETNRLLGIEILRVQSL
ncbi:stalk domain-containing protein [Effusibacillus pohliae]|uniref:stalk domain-containing protein n=1 Tax=Effusibacillus pohliae TaxID=232270 RepID=UPI000369B1AC|nr:stalk domain-containing protein [Effusibacillus pohliae]